ncbi:uncharacterized protein LOC127849845 [Dreissena polymorpha]|uniref:uncharacterized protein LOC127849845 n=1 Tax=Dreissena polymorpha TaxID=45954 RepID=UPI002264EBC5|nr:uncharacterized protein LOC127849845 [Dreissena polymorpha]
MRISTDLTRFWSKESMGITPDEVEDRDDAMNLRHYQEHSISFTDGKYKAKLPWKQNHPPPPTNNFIKKIDGVSTSKRLHYIPHHGVKKDSTATLIRLVYDCNCRASAGSPSLNDCLESTSPELNTLTTLLMRFRLKKYAVSADIEKAISDYATTFHAAATHIKRLRSSPTTQAALTEKGT